MKAASGRRGEVSSRIAQEADGVPQGGRLSSLGCEVVPFGELASLRSHEFGRPEEVGSRFSAVPTPGNRQNLPELQERGSSQTCQLGMYDSIT